MVRAHRIGLAVAVALVVTGAVRGSMVSGDPAADAGWAAQGNALESGVYVKGSANYGFQTYSAALTVTVGSNLEISDGSLSWVAGDTVLGVGGVFESITAGDAGWAGFSGGAINALLAASTGPKLQAKFGTSAATWTTSSIAPNAGDGNSSSSAGGGRVQVRTSAYFRTGTPDPGQTEPWTWDGNSGQVLVLDKDSHIAWDGASVQPSKKVARMIWVWDAGSGEVASWELLLNVSLLARVAPGDFTGLFPAAGDMAIMTVQDGDNAYTDALVMVVPEPAGIGLLVVGGLAVLRRRR